jgi:DNA-binding protein H-NS
MKDIDLDKMNLDDLWHLHERISSILERKIETEKRKLQRRLDELGRKSSEAAAESPRKRPYPKVIAKYQNPDNPSQTWSGRGRQPRWVIALLARGRDINDFKFRRPGWFFLRRCEPLHIFRAQLGRVFSGAGATAPNPDLRNDALWFYGNRVVADASVRLTREQVALGTKQKPLWREWNEPEIQPTQTNTNADKKACG